VVDTWLFSDIKKFDDFEAGKKLGEEFDVIEGFGLAKSRLISI